MKIEEFLNRNLKEHQTFVTHIAFLVENYQKSLIIPGCIHSPLAYIVLTVLSQGYFVQMNHVQDHTVPKYILFSLSECSGFYFRHKMNTHKAG